MKLAFAGKGGVGKTTLCAWMGDWLARQGRDVWLVDADTALSLGRACGLAQDELPTPLAGREDLIRERIGEGFMHLTPDVSDLPEALAVELPRAPGAGLKRLLVMGSIAGAGGGCACSANALLKALLAHLVCEPGTCLLVDLEAGVEHLGRGTIESVDGLVVVSEPSLRGLETAVQVSRLGRELGVQRQVLALNRHTGAAPRRDDLPEKVVVVPPLPGLGERQLVSASVLDLPERETADAACAALLRSLDGEPRP